MARIQTKQHSFSRGVVSEKLIERNDTDVYAAGLADGENFIVDGRGGLEKRPGSVFIGATKGGGFATLLPFAFSRTQAYAVEAGHEYFRFYTNYAILLSGSAPLEVATPFDEEDVEKITFAQSNDVMFLACEGYKYARLVRTGPADFQLANFDTFDGPYLDLNPVGTNLLSVFALTISATGSGFAPFTPQMVGRWVRIRTPNTDSADNNQLGDEFLWASFKIVSYISPTQVGIDQSDGDIAPTADWRLGAFFEGQWPDVVTMHQGRLWLFKGNRGWGSKPQDFNNFAPTYLSPMGGSTGRVEPDSSISIVIDSGLSQQGAVTKIYWAKSQNFQLVLGTPVGIITIQATSLGEALTPENVVVRVQDARGANQTLPVTVNESTIFAHTTGMRLQGTYYRDGAYDRLGAQDLSLTSDTLVETPIRRISWQDYPHGMTWIAHEDGKLNGLTLQPEEKVQGWYPQRMGGEFLEDGAFEHPHVEAVLSLPSPDGKRDDEWMIVRRTINGTQRRYLEIIRPFWAKGRDVRDAWFLDCALRYDGNDDLSQTISIIGDDPNFPFTITPNFLDPPFVSGSRFAFHDGRRWHPGTILEVNPSTNVATWYAEAPNSPAGPADGLRWFDIDGTWIQPARGDPEFFKPTDPSYEGPALLGSTWRWSMAVDAVGGLEHLVGQTVRGLVDGIPTLPAVVNEFGEVDFGVSGYVVLVGLPYESTGQLLPLNEGAQAGTADEKQRPIYSTGVSVWETWGLECGTGTIDTAGKQWAQYVQTVYPQPYAAGMPAPLFTGYQHFPRPAQGDAKNPIVAFRHAEPLPCYIRGVINRISTSDGA